MKLKNSKIIPPYWDDQPYYRQYPWYKKRWWKRYLNKKWMKEQLKSFDKE